MAVADSPEREGVVWVYSGFGSQHRKMGKELYQLSPQFAARLHEIDEVVDRESGWSVVEMILDDAQNFGTETAQVGITAIQIALTDLMTGLGLRPAAVVGQSMGEIAAGYAVGGLTMEDAVTIACHRARLMGEGETLLPEDKQGAMAVIELGVDDLVEFQKEHPEFAAVEPAVYAAPGMTTVGGPAQPVADLVEHLDGQGKFARLLKVKGAGHTSMLDPILGELAAEISDIAPQAIHTPLYSTVDRGVTYNPGETVHDAEYFLRCTRYSVWFSDATGRLFDEGFRTFVEFSPNPVALMPMMNTAFAHEAGESSLMYLLKRKEPSVDTLLRTVGELYVRGGDVDFRTLYATDADRAGGARSGAAGAAAHRVSQDIPGVHWNLQRYWTAARPGGGAGRGIPGRRVSLPDGRTAFAAAVSDVPSVESVAEAAVHAVSPESSVTAFRGHARCRPPVRSPRWWHAPSADSPCRSMWLMSRTVRRCWSARRSPRPCRWFRTDRRRTPWVGRPRPPVQWVPPPALVRRMPERPQRPATACPPSTPTQRGGTRTPARARPSGCAASSRSRWATTSMTCPVSCR